MWENLKKIKTEIAIIKPEFKLSYLQTKMEKQYQKLKQEKENWINSDELISLKICYVLKNKSKAYLVLKQYTEINDKVQIEKWNGNYTGYLIDLFTGNTLCHFKQTIDYKKENFDFDLMPDKWKNYELSPILDYLDIDVIHNQQVLLSTLKKLYLKLNK